MKMIAIGAISVAIALAACGSGTNAASNTPANNSTPGATAANTDDTTKVENPTPEPINAGTATERDALVEKAWGYVKGMYQGKDNSMDEGKVGIPGGWGRKSTNIPYTAMVLQAMHGTRHWDSNDEMFKDSVAFLVECQEATGAWSYAPIDVLPAAKGVRAVYITAIVVELFSDLNKSEGPWKGKLNDSIGKGRDYITQSQVGNPEGPAPKYERAKVGFGGWAYSKEEITESVDKKGKPASNMSTTAFAIDALHACGVKESDPLWKDALLFLKRNQNAGEVHDEGWAATFDGKKVKYPEKNDPNYGGSVYSEETSKPGTKDNEDGTVTLLSYGTMTYNLLRSYIFAGLKKDDVPVQLAWGWIQRNYTVEKVPGWPDAKNYERGLFYYYHSMAKTLDAMDVDVVEEPDRGLKHDWRADLVGALKGRQKADGSWVNSNANWQEDSPMLCTCYALIALKHTK
jgi:hypothetical protein